MLVRNIDVNTGTTIKIISITTKILKLQITNGSHIGDYALIPRIELSPSDSLLPFGTVGARNGYLLGNLFGYRFWHLSNCQESNFLINYVSNKAQGQSINNLGVYLPQPVFSHG